MSSLVSVTTFANADIGTHTSVVKPCNKRSVTIKILPQKCKSYIAEHKLENS